MKIENIEKACYLKNDLEAVNELLESEHVEHDKVGKPSSYVLMLYYNNRRYNVTNLISQKAKTKIMDIIFDDCREREKQIKQEIEEL